MKRLFAAVKINPSEKLVETYNSMKARLRFASIKWVPIENIHVTLKFFGETEESRIPPIKQALENAARQHAPFSIQFENTGIFGSSYNPRVIWFGMGNTEPLASLTHSVFDEVEKIGWERDRQNFVPHLTIGRIKHVPDKKLFQNVIDQHKDVFLQDVEVREYHLYESILKREGPVYTILETFSLSLSG